ncbi:hypothetical protein SNE25_14250 [Mucilaginibacter sabulilitoris]|uniref:Uncharacterized protein n=1 Tax=Mucilaginibacter sabulilitoris TaxID=1173583 RepID=A0ABZ0TW27_9SPHI|nr:hypothetical protein [Mucilaginibacter sabulilitoris]WPU96682.1 hypothetical protein SNE25_14250 [Mucilaginibacter sabulilitoris]
MFNLPIPTDSLYKFAFMFGLLLIVFSFYYRDRQLDEYDKHQVIYQVDSLEKVKDDSNFQLSVDSDVMKGYTADLESKTKANLLTQQMIIQDLNDLVNQYPFILDDRKAAKIYKQETDTTIHAIYPIGVTMPYLQNFKEFCSRINSVLWEKNEKVINEYEFYSSKLELQERTFELLAHAGLLLFFPGLLLWYFQIQRPQDKLLKIQLAEAKKKVTITGRKHFEPKILPRPKVRNRV